MAAFLLRLVAETSRERYTLGLILSAFVVLVCAVRLTRVDPRISTFVRGHHVLRQRRVARRMHIGMVAYPLRLIAETLCTYRALALIMPIALLVFWAVRGTRDDPRVNDILRSPSVLERFRQANDIDPNDRREEISPLVRQAQFFAQYLDPAPASEGGQPSIRNVGPVAPIPTFSSYTAKFVLHGTCYYPSRPDESIALVWQPGGGGSLQWVKQGDRLGHFVVEEIGRSSITYEGAGQTHEMKVQRSSAPGNLVRRHRTDPSRAGNGTEALDAIVLNNERLLVEAGNEEETAPEQTSGK